MKIQAQIKPGSTKGPLVETLDGNSLVVYVKERTIDGKANDAVIKLLSSHFKVPQSSILLVSGHKSRFKVFDIKA